MNFSFFSLVLCILLPTLTTSTPHHRHSHHHHHHHHGKVDRKPVKFTLYFQDTLNKTSFYVVNGVTKKDPGSELTSSFGSMLVFSDPLTEKPEPTSKVMGSCEGTTVTTRFTGELAMSFNRFYIDNVNGCKGELISVNSAYFDKVSEFPIIAGTGDLRGVQGYVICTPINIKGPTITYKFDFYLHWPPYYSALMANY